MGRLLEISLGLKKKTATKAIKIPVTFGYFNGFTTIVRAPKRLIKRCLLNNRVCMADKAGSGFWDSGRGRGTESRSSVKTNCRPEWAKSRMYSDYPLERRLDA